MEQMEKFTREKLRKAQKKEVRKVEVKTKTKLKLIVDLPSFAERAA